MKYIKLGKTDITVSVIAMGCWALAGDLTWGSQDERESIETVRAALDEGVNFFDTAEAYGDGYSEFILGKALANHRKEVFIATKVVPPHLSNDELIKACERSLKNLNTDYIDLYQIHWPDRNIPFEETIEAMERLYKQGKIRAIGVSNFGVNDMDDLLKVGTFETNQLPYNLLWRAIEYDIIKKCLDNGIGILCYSPLAQGLLTGKFSSADQVPEGRARTRHFSKERHHTRHNEDGCEKETFEAIERIRPICKKIGEPMAKVALAWLLHQQGVTSVVAGARRPDQIKKNVQALDLELSTDNISELTNATEEVKQKLGSNPDMWMSESRMR